MTSPRDDAWRVLSERRLLGERLSDREDAELEAARERDPACAAELDLFEELADVLDHSNDAADPAVIAMARAALARAEEPATADAPLRRPRRWAVGGIAAAAAAVLAIGWWATRPAPPEAPPEPIASARLLLVTGDVYVDGEPMSSRHLELGRGSTIAVQSGRACFSIDGGIDVCLAAETTATLHALDGAQPWVELRRGHAAARLDPQPEGRSFSLGDAQMHATAVGTVFSLSAPSAVRTTTSVLQGIVDVRVAGQTLRLSAQEAAWIEGGVVGRGPVSAADESLALELLAPVQQIRRGDGGHLAVVASPAGVPVRVDGLDVGASPVLVALAAGEHRIEVGTASGARVAESVHITADEVVERRFDLPAVATPAVPEPAMAQPDSGDDAVGTPSVPTQESSAAEVAEPGGVSRPPRSRPVVSAAELLADARELRRLDRWHDAARAYRDLLKAHPRSSEAQTAWVSLGDLQLDRLGKPAAAAKSYARYLATGSTLLAAEARYGRVRAFRALGDADREREAIDVYLRYHGGTVRARALRVRAEQLREAGP